MEQRLFLAVILSILVIIGYNTLLPKQLQKSPITTSQKYLPEATTKTLPSQSPESIAEIQPETIPNNLKEDIQVIENEYFRIEFTNIGGAVKSVEIKKYSYKLPLTGILQIEKYKTSPFNFDGYENGKVQYSYQNGNVLIVRQYNIPKDSNTMLLQQTIKNISGHDLSEEVNFENFNININNLDQKLKTHSDFSLFEYSVSLDNSILRKSNATKFSPKENIAKQGSLNWVGFRDKYFCILIKPEYATKGYHVKEINEKELAIITESNILLLKPDETVSLNLISYIGPQDIKILKDLNLGFENIVVFSNYSPLDAISKGIISLINFIHKIVPSWGLAIILISVLVYGAMYPLTLKAMTSMRRMQLLQPEMAKMKEQYKNNPQRLNKELMELYKVNKVNPLGGCFPFLLQMPVFIGLYQALWRSVYFKGESFLWIKDLSQPDKLFVLPFTIPVINTNEFNILPLLMMVVMFFQQKLSSKNVIMADPNQAAQQRIMTIFFPIFLGFIFYKFASGLTLYFTVFYILSTVTQWKMSKVNLTK